LKRDDEAVKPVNQSDANATQKLDAEDIDQKIVEDVIRMSLEEISEVSEKTNESPATAVTITPPLSSKPAVRFISDVTFPDGTKVQPGTVFTKIWRVRNDGESTWPEGTVLVHVGGDVFDSAPLNGSAAGKARHISPNAVPLAKVQEEVEISASLTAPQATGRHIAYFRLQTKDGVCFGQRLWADIRVVEDDAGWQLVNSGILIPTTEPAAVIESKPEGELDGPTIAAVPTVNAEAVAIDDVNLDLSASSVSTAGNSTEELSSAADIAANVWSRVWSAELEVLAMMGFTDVKAIIPILQEHVKIPVSLAADQKTIPDPEGMQRVVLQLLSQSGKFN